MIILVLNCGSSSLKFQLVNMETKETLCKGLCERIGIEGSSITYSYSNVKINKTVKLCNHLDALESVINLISKGDTAVINSIDEIKAVGHRIGHGGEVFKESQIVSAEVLAEIEKLAVFTPLHAPAMINGIKSAMSLFSSSTPSVAVFDTTFHSTIPPKAYIYALPYEYYEKYGVRRFGFHGTSHKYVSQVAADYLGKDIEKLKIITCHLGNGSSVTAIENGKSVDTSMGFTPVAGLVMGTRCGDVDVGAILYLQEKLNLNASQMNDILNKESGLLGISGLSPDSRDIVNAASNGHERAKLANEVMCYNITKHIGAYAAVMGGLDILIFTGGIGEKDAAIRAEICERLGYMGIELDKNKNNEKGLEINNISAPNSKAKTLVICTDEEMMIAKDTLALVTNN